jgi:hypothetical protein
VQLQHRGRETLMLLRDNQSEINYDRTPSLI